MRKSRTRVSGSTCWEEAFCCKMSPKACMLASMPCITSACFLKLLSTATLISSYLKAAYTNLASDSTDLLQTAQKPRASKACSGKLVVIRELVTRQKKLQKPVVKGTGDHVTVG